MILQQIDWLIIASFFIISVAIGLWVAGRAGKDSSEFFLSGRHMPWYLLGTSMVATTFSIDTPKLGVVGISPDRYAHCLRICPAVAALECHDGC
jgi:Na+/proline symporter